ncbi:MAG: protein kinase [bacterium]|nr:protein kinase [bacterium]
MRIFTRRSARCSIPRGRSADFWRIARSTLCPAGRLLDFGIAKLLAPDDSPQTVATTRAGLQPMTPEYASPEQLAGRRITTASDVYSLGMLFCKLLTGELPEARRGGAPRGGPVDAQPRGGARENGRARRGGERARSLPHRPRRVRRGRARPALEPSDSRIPGTGT